MTVKINEAVYHDVLAEARKYSDVETGGVWLGQVLGDICVITHNIHPGNNALHLPGCFAYDADCIEREISSIFALSNESLSVIGYWHTHTSGRNTFSDNDAPLNTDYAHFCNGIAICGIVTTRGQLELTLYSVSLPLRYTKLDYSLIKN